MQSGKDAEHAWRTMSRNLGALCGTVLWLLAAAAQAAPVRIGEQGIAADAPFYIGIEKGYFAAHGIEVALTRFKSAAEATAPLGRGQLEVVGGGMSAGLFNAFARDLPIKVVMARTRDMPGYSSDTLVVRDDLKPAIASFKDLKGKKIASNAPAGVLDFMIGEMLATDGMSMSDIDLSYMSWPDMGIALQNHAIDAGAAVEPFVTQFAERGIAFPFKRAAAVFRDPPLEVSVILYNQTWMEEKPDDARAFTVAYLAGVRDYYDAMKGGAKRSEVIDILVKYTAVKDKAIYERMQWSYMDPNAELSVADLRDQQDWYAARGAVQKKVDIDSMIDRRDLNYALQKLGRSDAK